MFPLLLMVALALTASSIIIAVSYYLTIYGVLKEIKKIDNEVKEICVKKVDVAQVETAVKSASSSYPVYINHSGTNVVPGQKIEQ